VSVSLPIELDREDDGRWIAEIRDLPVTLCDGKNRDEAIARVEIGPRMLSRIARRTVLRPEDL
jgi:hypothetical protein